MMEKNIQDILKMIKKKDMVDLNGLMVKFMKVASKMMNCMVKVK